jgi:sialic acid synthase SpsE
MKSGFVIGWRQNGIGFPEPLIAEVGLIHSGDENLAGKMIDAAVDAINLQPGNAMSAICR